MKNEYDVVYVKRTRNVAKFAADLKEVLNRASSEKWDIVRWDVEPGGHLLALRRVVPTDNEEAGLMPTDIREALASLLQTRPPKLSAETGAFFNGVMEEVGGFEKKLITEKMGKVVASRRMSNDKLRPILEELKTAREMHMRGHDAEPCDFIFALDALIEHAEQSVRLGVS